MGDGESFYSLYFCQRLWDIVKDAVLCFLPLPSYVVGVYAEPACCCDLMDVT